MAFDNVEAVVCFLIVLVKRNLVSLIPELLHSVVYPIVFVHKPKSASEKTFPPTT